ncbi:MAG: ABC transporter permease [Acidimicrobiales bacterium]
MRVLAVVARQTFRRMTAYRGATAAGLFTNTVFGFLIAYVLLAVYRERPDVGGFDAVDAVTFTFVAQSLIMVVGLFGDNELPERIRTGDVVADLFRPVDLQAWLAAVAYGKAAFYAIFRGVVPFVVGAVVFDLRTPPPSVWPWFVVSVLAAVAVAFGWRFLLALSAFWLLDDRGVSGLGLMTALFLSGLFVPVVFFPAWLETLARALPFASMLQVPAEVFLGKHVGADAARTVAVQLAWALALAAAGRVVLARAVRRVVVQGG